MAVVGKAGAATDREHAERQIEVQRRLGDGGQHESGSHGDRAERQHALRAVAIDPVPEQREAQRRDDEAHREDRRGEPALPTEFGDDRRKEQREDRARARAHAERQEPNRDDDPTVIERQAPCERAGERCFGSVGQAVAPMLPAVQVGRVRLQGEAVPTASGKALTPYLLRHRTHGIPIAPLWNKAPDQACPKRSIYRCRANSAVSE